MAYRILLTLVELSDATGLTSVTVAGLTRRTGLSAHQVGRALSRLRSIGAVEDLGWTYANVRHTKAERSALTGTMREVYQRRVHARRGTDTVRVPSTVAERIATMPTHGGARVGAGRKSSRRGVETIKSQGCPQMPEKMQERIKSVDRIKREEKETKSSVLFPSERERAPEARSSSFSGSIESMPVAVDESGSTLVGGGRPPVLPLDTFAVLPPFPGVEVVRPAVVPEPPMVTASMSEDEQVALLRDAYNMAVSRALPNEFNPNARRAVSEPDRKVLLKAAPLLVEHAVSPLRWCEHSLVVWSKGREQDASAGRKERASRPSLRVVYAPKRIAETAGWARNDHERRTARVMLGRSHRTLIERWREMSNAVLRGELSPQAACERFFPGDTYERAVEKARADARRIQADLDTRLAAGEYLWP